MPLCFFGLLVSAGSVSEAPRFLDDDDPAAAGLGIYAVQTNAKQVRCGGQERRTRSTGFPLPTRNTNLKVLGLHPAAHGAAFIPVVPRGAVLPPKVNHLQVELGPLVLRKLRHEVHRYLVGVGLMLGEAPAQRLAVYVGVHCEGGLTEGL